MLAAVLEFVRRSSTQKGLHLKIERGAGQGRRPHALAIGPDTIGKGVCRGDGGCESRRGGWLDNGFRRQIGPDRYGTRPGQIAWLGVGCTAATNVHAGSMVFHVRHRRHISTAAGCRTFAGHLKSGRGLTRQADHQQTDDDQAYDRVASQSMLSLIGIVIILLHISFPTVKPDVGTRHPHPSLATLR